MSYEFGDVVLIPFPFTHHAASKKRPAIVVSGASYNRSKPDVLVMAVTSQLRNITAPGEVLVSDWPSAGLLKPSAIKPVFATVEQTLVIRHLGRLARADQTKLSAAICVILG